MGWNFCNGSNPRKKKKTLILVIMQSSPHRESVSGLGGFRLGFVHDPPRLGGSGLYQNALILYHLTTARGLGGWRTQRFGVLYSKFEFAVQDAIKTPKLKPRSRKRVLG